MNPILFRIQLDFQKFMRTKRFWTCPDGCNEHYYNQFKDLIEPFLYRAPQNPLIIIIMAKLFKIY